MNYGNQYISNKSSFQIEINYALTINIALLRP